MLATPRHAAAAILVLAGLCGTAQADSFGWISFHSYKLEHRPKVVFPGNSVHVSPYPASKRAASIWASDFCWRDCTGQSGWKFQDCARVAGLEACRPVLNADNRTCLRACRLRGGPMLNLAF